VKTSEANPPFATPDSIYSGPRIDYDMIEDLVDQNSRVLDIGCGNGELLCRLVHRKNVRGLGLELDQENVISAIGCGVSVIHADIDEGLAALPDRSFDVAILSMTLQVLKKPDFVLREMVRIAKKCIVSFPNFGHWRVRSKAFFQGRAPVTRHLPYAWYDSPNRHVLTIRDFHDFCRSQGVRIEREIPVAGERPVRFLPNLLAEEALYVLTKH
jgi:methionine biosynthesis protein MetW